MRIALAAVVLLVAGAGCSSDRRSSESPGDTAGAASAETAQPGQAAQSGEAAQPGQAVQPGADGTAAASTALLRDIEAATEPGANSAQAAQSGADGNGTGAPSRVPGGPDMWEPNATVEAVIDGDTIIAKIGSNSESLRLIGIDTPESVARYRPVECYGSEASRYLHELLPPGTPITVIRDTELRDIYDRLLGYVVRSGDGLFVNLELVVSGHAAKLNFPPNDTYAVAMARAEAQARSAGLGLWGACGGPDTPLE